MSAATSEAAINKLAAKRAELGAEDFGAYAFLVLGLLGHHAPELLAFLIERADERVQPSPPEAAPAKPSDPLRAGVKLLLTDLGKAQPQHFSLGLMRVRLKALLEETTR